MITFPAKRPGSCAGCGQRYPARTPIAIVDGVPWHVRCAPDEPAPPEAAPDPLTAALAELAGGAS